MNEQTKQMYKKWSSYIWHFYVGWSIYFKNVLYSSLTSGSSRGSTSSGTLSALDSGSCSESASDSDSCSGSDSDSGSCSGSDSGKDSCIGSGSCSGSSSGKGSCLGSAGGSETT